MHAMVRGTVYKNISTLHATAETLAESEEIQRFIVLESKEIRAGPDFCSIYQWLSVSHKWLEH